MAKKKAAKTAGYSMKSMMTKMMKRSAHGSGPFTEAEIKQGYKTISRGCNYDDMGKWNSEHQNAGTKGKGYANAQK